MAESAEVLGGDSKAAWRDRLTYVGLFCLVWWVFAAVVGWAFATTDDTDYAEYLKIVVGRMNDAHQPFAGRLLAPMMARAAVLFGGADPGWALGVVCALGWMLAAVLAGLLLYQRRVSRPWAMVVASLPFTALETRYFQVPDGWSCSMALLIFLALENRRRALGAGAAFVLAFARSTSIFSVVLTLIARRRRIGAVLAVVVLAGFLVGVALKSPLMKHNVGNVHGMSDTLYLVAKTPVNALGNIAGTHIYVNTFPYCTNPAVTFPPPHLPGLGHITTMGLCRFNPTNIFHTLQVYVSIFGLIPLLAGWALWARRRQLADLAEAKPELWVFLFGYLVSPAFGLNVPRLFLEGYPLLYGAVAVLGSQLKLTPRTAGLLILYNLAGIALLAHHY